ncbi:MAG: ECF transporter S component [archaeon]|nr:ECF transporter S component [archaeon]
MTKTEAKVKQPYWTPKRIARMAIFIALSAVGSFIKIPSPTGTVALDSLPGYFSAVAWGYLEGGIVIALGHILTAATVGFPMTVPVHILVAVTMIAWAAIFRWTTMKIHWIAGIIAGTFFNGVVAPVIFIPILLPLGGWGLFYAMVLSLVVASFVNVAIAGVANQIVKKAGYI